MTNSHPTKSQWKIASILYDDCIKLRQTAFKNVGVLSKQERQRTPLDYQVDVDQWRSVLQSNSYLKTDSKRGLVTMAKLVIQPSDKRYQLMKNGIIEAQASIASFLKYGVVCNSTLQITECPYFRNADLTWKNSFDWNI